MRLLGASDIRRLAEGAQVRPTKQKGQNFVVDGNTVRRIVRIAGVTPHDVVLEVGPGLGSLTLALAEVARRVVAVEIDEVLAALLPATLAEFAPGLDVEVVLADALQVHEVPGPPPTALVANLPYNVSVPVLLNVLQRFPSIDRALVMVQAEVAHRLAAGPGSRTYGVPSVKAAWYGETSAAGNVGRSVFWPMPNVESELVGWRRHAEPLGDEAARLRTFAVIDAAFAQRRKTLRSALSGLAGSGAVAEAALLGAGIDPRTRGEQLDVHGFRAIADGLAIAPPADPAG